MKALFAIAAVAVSNIAIAAPQTIYFAGNIYDGSTVQSDTGTWVPIGVGGTFSGSITVNGAKNVGGSGSWSMQLSNGLADAVVSSFVFNYGGRSYSRLAVPPNTGYDTSFLSKESWGEPAWPPFEAIPYGGIYKAAVYSEMSEFSSKAGTQYLSRTSRSATLTLQGGEGFIGDVFDLSALPDLAAFDPAKSEFSLFDTSYTCQYIQAICVDGSIRLGQGSTNLYGRLTQLSTVPLTVSELPEPGSIALVALGIMGLAGVRSRRTKPVFAI